MDIVMFASSAGGEGRSTLAINTAISAAQLGEKVCLVDLDPWVGTTSHFMEWREQSKKDPEFKGVEFQKIEFRQINNVGPLSDDGEAIKTAINRFDAIVGERKLRKNCTLMVVDTVRTDPITLDLTAHVAGAADLCLYTVRAFSNALTHIRDDQLEMLRSHSSNGARFAFVLNQGYRAKDAAFLREALAFKGTVLSMEIPSNSDISEATGRGLGIAEAAGECHPAVDQFNILTEWCRDRIKRLKEK